MHNLSKKQEDVNQRKQLKKARTQWEMMWIKFKRNRLANIGLVIIGIIFILSFFAPFFAPYDYTDQNLRTTYIPPQKIHFIDENGQFHLRPFTYKLKKGIDPETFALTYNENLEQRYNVYFLARSWEYEFLGLFKTDLHLFTIEDGGSFYLLGTDHQGRDLFSRILFGGRISISVALLGAIVSVVIGSIFGAISGYYSGILDMILQRIAELVRCFPRLPLWMALSLAIPAQWPPIFILYGIVGIFALLNWPTLAREVRGKVLSYREEDFVLATKALGGSDRLIIFRHILPHALSHIVVVLTINIPWLILAESMLSFLGLGLQPPMVSWGILLQKAQNFQTLGEHPWIMIPGIFIMITVLGFNFLGDGLRDAADPFSQ